MVIASLFNVFYMLIMRNYMKSIPDSLVESARMDGAGDFTVYARIVVPLLPPALATIGLFTALAYWNSWYPAMLFIDSEKWFPLQYYLYRILNSIRFINAISENANIPMPQLQPSLPV